MGANEAVKSPLRTMRSVRIAALAAVVVSVGLTVPLQAAAQARCRSFTGPELQRLRRSLDRQRILRDSVERILVEAEAYDSTGALLVWTDEEEMRMKMALVNLDPPVEAYYKIRGLLAGHFRDTPPGDRDATVDLDAPEVTVDGDSAFVCGCGVPEETADRHLGEYMKRAIRRHPDFGLQTFDEVGKVSVFVDWQGNVLHAVLDDSTGDGWLDRVIPPVARKMEFEPASVDGTPRGAWLSRELRFRSVAH